MKIRIFGLEYAGLGLPACLASDRG